MSQPQSGIQRQHELDALRAFAMLLGIALHGALSFAPGFPWVVQDTKPEAPFIWLFYGIHGFRMALFFLISGYFTMLLWRRRGLVSLLKQRALRVLLPCLLGLVTILPLTLFAFYYSGEMARRQEDQKRATSGDGLELIPFIRNANHDELESYLIMGEDPNQTDKEFGIPILGWAGMYGDTTAAQLLLDYGADTNGVDREGHTPLHQSAFLGQSKVLEMLLKNGGNPQIRGKSLQSPLDSTKADFNLTKMMAEWIRVPLPSEEQLETGRAACRKLLDPTGSQNSSDKPQAEGLQGIRDQYRAFLNSERWQIKLSKDIPPFQLIQTGIFIHLWFLWFLWYLVVIFAFFVLLAQIIPLPKIPSSWILSPLRWLWVFPLTLLPQLLMGQDGAVIGPDTAAGVIPAPHVLFYYAIFFFFGALYFDQDDKEGKLCRWWWLELPICLLIALPLGIMTLGQTVLSGCIQVFYVWAMSTGMIGLFRTIVTKESPTIRFVSDSAYWLYLIHLALMAPLQALVRPWDLPTILKFTFVCTITTVVLLISYRYMVRYTWIGWLLNGTRKRHHQTPEPVTPTPVAPA